MLFSRLLRPGKPIWLTGRSIPAHATPIAHFPPASAASSMPSTSALKSESGGIKPFSEIPGPKPLPIVRNLLEIKKNSGNMMFYLEECYKNYGEIFKLEVPGGNNFVYMANPNMLENILRAEGKYPRRENTLSPNLEWMMSKLQIPAPFAIKSGEEWKKGRSAVNKQIKPSNVQLYIPGLNDVVVRFTNYLSSAKDENDQISDISRPLRRLLVELSAKFVFDDDLHVFDNPTADTEQFIEGVTLCFDCFGKMIIEPPLYKLYPNKLYRDFKKGVMLTKAYGMKHAERVHQKIESKEEGNEVKGLLEQWLREGKMTEREALSLATDLFTAGVDTTSNQAAFLLYCMAKNPEAQETLYKEIQSVLGDQTEPTPEDISKMPFLKSCMMESFRMYSTSGMNTRVLTEETTLMGYHIPAETNVGYLHFLVGKNEQHFPNPDKFDPARWARDKPNPFALLPFGFGPRSCYGKRFAELELKLLLCQMIQKFVLGTDLDKLDTEYSVVLRPATNLPLYLKSRI